MSKKHQMQNASNKNGEDRFNLKTGSQERTIETNQANRAPQDKISAKELMEKSLEAEHKRFNDVLETLPVYLVLLTPDYHVAFANRFFRERFGESHGKRCFEYLFGRTERCEICETYTVLKTMSPHNWEWTGPDGRNYDIHGFPFIDADGSTLILEMGIDITKRKRVEQELRRHQEHLVEMVKERTVELERKNTQLSAEITERKRTEDALRRAKDEWERTFNIIPDMIAVLDDRHRIVRVNQTMAKRLDRTPDQCVGLPCYEVMHGTNEPLAFCPHLKSLADGLEHTSELHEERLGGDFLISTTPILDEEGQVIGSVHVVRDVTELKKAEEQIRSVALFPEENPFPIMRTSVSGTLIYANRSAAELLEQWQCNIGALVPEMIRQKVLAAAKSGRQQEMEIRCGMQDLSFALVPIPERGYVNFYGRDITEMKKVETALRENEARFMLLSETSERLLMSEDPISIINDLCKKVMVHLDCHVFFNFLADEKAGRLHLNAYAGISEKEAGKIEWLDYGVAVCGCVARDGVPFIAEDICTTQDPRTELVKSYGIQAYACNPLIAHGSINGTISFGTKTRTSFSPEDLTLMKTVTDQVATAMEQMRLIKELQRSRDELEIRVQDRTAELQKSTKALERSNRELDSFAHVASHDLQEPLRKIQTFADRLMTIQQESLDGKTRDYLNRMRNAAGRMQTLVQDLLRYSRVTSRTDPFKLINLKIPVDEAVTDLTVLFEETGGSIEIGDLPEIEADQIQMRQLFQNLISNGLKYHGEGRPVIRVYSNPSSQDKFHEIHVGDNGIGFDESHLDKIFMPFQRLHGKSSPYTGTGMGLAICRRILEHHGGSITARSEPGKGATFIVRLPKKRGEDYRWQKG
jgi:PAS domain S-box-containing protein